MSKQFWVIFLHQWLHLKYLKSVQNLWLHFKCIELNYSLARWKRSNVTGNSSNWAAMRVYFQTRGLFAGLPVAMCRATCHYHRLAQFAVQYSLSGGNASLSYNYSANSHAALLHLRPDFQPSHFIKSTGEGCTSANRFDIIMTLLFCCSKRFSDRNRQFLLKYQIVMHSLWYYY